MKTRRQRRAATLAVMLALVALVAAGAWVWRTLGQARPQAAVEVVTPHGDSEEVSPSERRALEDILKRKGAGTQP